METTTVSPSPLLPRLGEVSPAEPPSCSLRVGVTGHRPPRLSDDQVPQVRDAVREVLAFIRGFAEGLVNSNQGYAMREPVLRITSALAEGADRLVAEEGLELGFELQCPLPAPRDEYRRDFGTPASAETFDRMLSRATAVFELDGKRTGDWLEPAAYEAAGRVMLAHSDIVIAVWDGLGGEQGGTAQIIGEAQRSEIPIVRIAPRSPVLIEILSPNMGTTGSWRDGLVRILDNMLLSPPSTRERVGEFLRESFGRGSGIDSIADQRDQADQIAGRYARRYRRAYKAVYLLAPMAVLFAIGGGWLVSNTSSIEVERLLTGFELLCILVILSVTLLGTRGRWHQRWIDARVLTEQFRTWVFLAPIAQTPPTSRLPPFISLKARQSDWTGWYFRARVREQRLRSAVLTPEYLANYRQQLLDVVAGQADHHLQKGGARMRTYELTEAATITVFTSTALVCLFHLISPRLLQTESKALLTALAGLTAALPAFGAALEGFQAQGEYQRLAERSEGMYHYLTALRNRIAALEGQAISNPTLADLAHQASGAMLDELSDWRNLVRVRILHPV